VRVHAARRTRGQGLDEDGIVAAEPSRRLFQKLSIGLGAGYHLEIVLLSARPRHRKN
jgi:hypothetical protein